VERYVPQLPSDAASLSYEDLVELGRQVVHAAQWAFGDLACAVETGYGESRLQEFAADIGLRYETLLNYRTVARAFPQSSRRRELSFGVHQALAGQDDRTGLIASRDDWTVASARDLASERREAAGQPAAASQREVIRPEPGDRESAEQASTRPAARPQEDRDSPPPASDSQPRLTRRQRQQQQWQQERARLQAEATAALERFGDLTLAELAEFGVSLWAIGPAVEERASEVVAAALPASYEGHGRREGEDYPHPEGDELAPFVRGWLDADDREDFTRRWVMEHGASGPLELARDLGQA
jgi:hypothetical protein